MRIPRNDRIHGWLWKDGTGGVADIDNSTTLKDVNDPVLGVPVPMHRVIIDQVGRVCFDLLADQPGYRQKEQSMKPAYPFADCYWTSLIQGRKPK